MPNTPDASPSQPSPGSFPETVSGGYGRQWPMSRPDRHDGIELVVMDSGSADFVFADRAVSATGGDLLLFWASLPHQVPRVKPRTYLYSFVVPMESFLRWQTGATLGARLLRGEVILLRRSDLGAMAEGRFELWARELKERAPAAPILLEMEAFFARLGAMPPGPESRPRSGRGQGGGLSAVERLARYAVEHAISGLTVETAARACGVHPSYAARVFRKSWGITYKSFILWQRVFHAQRLLATADAKVIEVAFASGFASLGRFYTAFQRFTGLSPHHYRRRCQCRAELPVEPVSG